MAGDTILVIDEGTTSTRAMLFAPDGTCLGSAGRELTQHYPRPGWVEHDADEIWTRTPAPARRKWSTRPAAADRIAAIGITNQRETICFWSKRTRSRWRRRSSGRTGAPPSDCARLKEAGHEPAVQAKTGLLLDPYFSASKIAWALREWPQLREAGDDLAIGTVESWLVFRLTGGLHVTDATNASRTALMDIHKGCWDEGLLRPVRRAARGAAGDRRLRRPVPGDAHCSAARSRSPAWPATSRRRRSARPASRPATPRRPTAPARSC